jgi:hypothetical protein
VGAFFLSLGSGAKFLLFINTSMSEYEIMQARRAAMKKYPKKMC